MSNTGIRVLTSVLWLPSEVGTGHKRKRMFIIHWTNGCVETLWADDMVTDGAMLELKLGDKSVFLNMFKVRKVETL